jgi:hypothetical protein
MLKGSVDAKQFPEIFGMVDDTEELHHRTRIVVACIHFAHVIQTD